MKTLKIAAITIVAILVMGQNVTAKGLNQRAPENRADNYWYGLPAIYWVVDTPRQAPVRSIWEGLAAGPHGAIGPLDWPPNFGGYQPPLE